MSDTINLYPTIIMNNHQSYLNNKNENKKKKDYNLGIGLLRIILSFMVVMDHFYNKKKIKKFLHILYYHIPSFFLLSFYFTYKTLISFNIPKIKLRFERILIPYFSWCIISWIRNNIYFYILDKKCGHSLKVFIFNLINGHMINVVLWFQNILILSTITFLIIIFIFKNNYTFILVILAIISYLLQYSGLNYTFFYNYSSSHFCLTFGRFAEVIPNGVTGFILASLEILTKFKNKRKEVIFFSLIIIILITELKIFEELKTFKYGGIRLNIAAICIFLIFSLLPFDIIQCKIIIIIIKQLSFYTGGVYFTHYLIGNGVFIRKIFKFINNDSILGCIKIYLISYLVSLIGAKIFKKTKFKHLFS